MAPEGYRHRTSTIRGEDAVDYSCSSKTLNGLIEEFVASRIRKAMGGCRNS